MLMRDFFVFAEEARLVEEGRGEEGKGGRGRGMKETFTQIRITLKPKYLPDSCHARLCFYPLPKTV